MQREHLWQKFAEKEIFVSTHRKCILSAPTVKFPAKPLALLVAIEQLRLGWLRLIESIEILFVRELRIGTFLK